MTDALEEKLRDIETRLNNCCCVNIVYDDEVSALIKAIRILLEANEFYGDRESYTRWHSKIGHEHRSYPTNSFIDHGHKARQARAEIEKILGVNE